MRQIAGDQQLVELRVRQVALQRLEHFRAVLEAALVAPGQVAQGPLVEQVPRAHLCQ